jgi:hypothetical protein
VSNKLDETSIGSEGYKISLLSATPGKIIPVANDFYQAIKKQTGREPVCFIQLFGKYDLCAIYRSNDFMGGPSKAGTIDNIRGGNQIFAFPWFSASTKRLRMTSGTRKKIWGLLFFRINESLAKQFGISIEEVLVEYWTGTKSQKVSLDILGTTGWAEVVFVVKGERFADVIEALTSIGKQAVGVVEGDKTTEHLFSAKTFSLIGFDFDLIAEETFSNLEQTFDEPIENGGSVFPRFNITCAPGDMHDVFNEAEAKLGSGYCAYGSTDLMFDADKCKSWGQFIRRVMEVRKKMQGKLYSTSVQIYNKPQEGDIPKDHTKLVKRKGLNVDEARLNLFQDWGSDFENKLLNLYFGISNLMQDPLIGDCFSDLKPVLDDELPRYLSEKSDDLQAYSNFIGRFIEAIAYGATERIHGAFQSLEYPQSLFSPTRGGIQRILEASGIVVKKVFERVGLKWNGFMIAGFQDLGFSSHHQIVNLPSDFLFRPEEWWGLFHEIGHAAFYDPKFTDLLENKDIAEVVDNVVLDKKDRKRVYKASQLVFEIGADSFDLYFCHRSDFNTYLTNIWPYILERGFKTSHFVRYFFMYQYWKYLLEGGETVFPKRINVDADVVMFKDMLKSSGLKCPEERKFEYAAAQGYRDYYRVIETLHASYSRKAQKDQADQVAADTNYEDMVATVLQGIVVPDVIWEPDQFILALNKAKDRMNFSSRMAAILSLWHTARME